MHHSSERYNLSTALRQPVADVLGVYVPYGLLARVGIRPALIEQARGVNLLYQYWIHTDAIRSLGAGEEVLNTPSHHRVHHGSNQQYLDRNHGSILIVWDRLFGTFQREDEPVVYGLTKNIDTYNPVRIASHEYADIVRDVAHSTNWRDRLSFVLRGPGLGLPPPRRARGRRGVVGLPAGSRGGSSSSVRDRSSAGLDRPARIDAAGGTTADLTVTRRGRSSVSRTWPQDSDRKPAPIEASLRFAGVRLS